MASICIIVALARGNVIGQRNDLPWHLPADLKHFRDITTGHTVVMGRKTLASILDRLGKPLPNRTNVVLTRQPDLAVDGVRVIHEVNDITDLSGQVYIIGGAEVYRQTMTLVDRLYVTEVHADIEGDSYFPEIKKSEWAEISREKHPSDGKNPYPFDFVIYTRRPSSAHSAKV